MAEKINLRARFPDGRNLTLSLPASTTYSALRSTLKERAGLPSEPEKVLLAGPPPTPLQVSADTQLSCFVRSGDSLIVEPTSAATARKPRASRKKKTMVERANEQMKKRASSAVAPNSKRPRVATLASSKGKGSSSKGEVICGDDSDDSNDANWCVALEEQSDDDAPATKQRSTAAGRSKRRAPPRSAKSKKAGSSSTGEGIDPLDVGAAQGEVGAALAESLSGNAQNGMGKTFRESLQNALKDRMAEAAGERRVSAWRSKNYRFTDVAGGFMVEFKSLDDRKWEKDFDGKACIMISKSILTAAIKEVVSGGDGEKLKEIEMARVSPRIFWNMVRLFPENIEDGLRELVPDIDWDFLDVRKRKLSRKAQRNLENKKEMGWTSD